MKYAILFSLLLVGVCLGSTIEQRRNTQDDSERMLDSEKDSNKGSDSRESKTTNEDSQKQSYDSQRQRYNSEKQGYETQKQDSEAQKQYDAQRQGYDSQSRDSDSQRQGYDSHRQNYDAQKQGFDAQRQSYDSQSSDSDSQRQGFNTYRQDSQKLKHHINKNFGWIEGDSDDQKLDQSEKRIRDDRIRDDSSLNVERNMKKDKSQRMQPDHQQSQGILGLGELSKNIGDYIRGIFGYGSNDSNVAKVYSDDVPLFVNPLDIGEVNSSFAMVTTKYNDVYFYGLKNAYQVVMDVDTKNHQIVTRIPLGKVEIKGQYTYSSRPIHNFTILLVDTVYIQTTSYTLKDKAVELGKCSGQIQYSHETSIYDRLGFIAQIVQGKLGQYLVTAVTPKVHEYVSSKLANLVERTILDVTENFERAQIVARLREGINETVKRIQENLASNGNANLELNRQNSHQYRYRHYKAEMLSVSLQNIQNLSLLSNKVTFTDTMIHSHVNLSLSQPIVSAHFSYHSDEDTEKHEISAQYSAENIHATLEMHKELGGGHLQLVSVKVRVSKLQVAPSQGHYKGELGGLVDSLGSKLQSHVSMSLENFLTSQVTALLAKANQGTEKHNLAHLGQKHESEKEYYENGYATKGKYSSGQSGKGEYSGSGHTDMGQMGNEQKSERRQYPGNLE